MLDISRIASGSFDPIARVVQEIRERAPGFDPNCVMLVGACCRDLIHAALGHDFELRATRALDLALAIGEWQSYELFASAFQRADHTGIGFKIAGVVADLLPFGDLENPRGRTVPPTRAEAISVWAFAEIFSSSSPLKLGPSLAIRWPTIPGYVAAKLGAWLDRSQWMEAKDANDIALATYWYANSKDVEDRLYNTPDGSGYSSRSR